MPSRSILGKCHVDRILASHCAAINSVILHPIFNAYCPGNEDDICQACSVSSALVAWFVTSTILFTVVAVLL